MTVNGIILLTGALFLLTIIITKLSTRFGIPALVVFLAMGMIVGRDGLELITFQDPYVAQFVGIFALVCILFEGGLRTPRETLQSVLAPAVSLSTLGVLLTSLFFGLGAHWWMGIPLELALLMGAIVGSTDAAAVISILDNQPIRERLRNVIESESGLNDPVAVVLTVLLIQWNLSPDTISLVKTGGYLLAQVVVGVLIGVLFGLAVHHGLRHVRLDSSGLYSLLLVAGGLFTYGVTSAGGGSGFLAVYLMGVMITDKELPFRHSILVFQEGFAGLMQIVLFLMLGLFVAPTQLTPVILPGIGLAVGLILVARPLAVLISLAGTSLTLREQLFVAWAGIRGAVPIVLATYALVAGVPGSELIFHVVFFVVAASALLQGWTVPLVARWLGVTTHDKQRPSVTLELITLDKLTADLLEITVPDPSPLEDMTVRKLNLPEDSNLCAIVRGETILTARGHTPIQPGDTLFILAHTNTIPTIKQQFQ